MDLYKILLYLNLLGIAFK